jgi:hypothetical protein
MAVIQDLRARKGLFVTENATVAGNAAVQQNLTVTNTAAFSNTLTVTGAATFANTINVTGNATFSNIVSFSTGNVTFDTDTLVIDAVNDRLSINAASATVAFFVNGDANVSGTFTTTTINATTINAGTVAANVFSVTGTTNTNIDSSTMFVDAVNNRVGINNAVPDASLTVTGTANVSSSFYVGGSTTLGGTLGTTGAATLSNTVGVTGAATFSNTMAVTGVATFSNTVGVTGAATFSNTMAVTGAATFTATIVGSVSGNANTCSRSISAGAYLVGGGALSVDRSLSVNATDAATASTVVARDASGSFSANVVTATLNGVAQNANFLLYGGTFRSATETNTGNSIVARDASGNFSANVMTGTATAARYADLAEKYLADAEYPIGTVISVGGEKEVTASTGSDRTRPIGVISENPAFMMNKDLEGGTYVALKGRVPVRVYGIVKKGDSLGPAHAPAAPGTAQVRYDHVFAVALTDHNEYSEGIVEAVIL